MPPSPDANGTSRAEYGLWLLTVVYIINFVDRQILSILAQAIKLDLGLADWQIGLLTGTAFGILYATLGIPIARLADRWSRTAVVSIALALWSAMTALCGTVSGFATLLVYRVGVGIGEAGCTPPAHSLLTDYFPAERRGRAFGIYALGVPVGVLIGFLLGGWLEHAVGWRHAFWIVGGPGVILAGVVWTTLPDPPRARASSDSSGGGTDATPAFGEVFRYLAGSNSFRMLALGAALYSFVGYTFVNWAPSMLIRSHGMSTQAVGTWLALVIGVGGCVGTFGGGWLADRLSIRNERARMWVPALAMVLSLPFSILIYTADSGEAAAAWSILPATLGLMWQAPAYALAQGLATPRTRATASAVVLFVINIIGLAVGPWITGLISDLLAPSHGVDSLRWAMLWVSLLLAPAAVCFWSASRTMVPELARAKAAAEREARGELWGAGRRT